jgi:hypothetical protein
VSWDSHHTNSERLAAEAERASRDGDEAHAGQLYLRAAEEETSALDEVGNNKPRTKGITVVSAVALWYKGHDFTRAEGLAHSCLAEGGLPEFAREQLRELLSLLWTAEAAERSGVRFMRGDVLVSVQGGEVIHGGAPLDLIVSRVEGIKAVLYRTVEMLLGRPLRKHGGPAGDIQEMFSPWLFQAPAGSYQFAVRMREPVQLPLWELGRPKIEGVTATFFSVLRATSSGKEEELSVVVPDAGYRSAFLNLSRGLAPTGKTFTRLEVRDASRPGDPRVTFETETRQDLNRALRNLRTPDQLDSHGSQEEVRGILRGVQLDKDWLEVRVDEEKPPIHISGVGEVLDDVIGPMVNRRVIVRTLRRGNKHTFQDIELEE